MISPEQQPAAGQPERAGDAAAARGAAFAPVSIGGLTAAIIGRDQELQELLTRFYRVLEGEGAQLVTVLGDPGIGKSRLAYELYQAVARLPESVRFYTFQGNPQRAAQPYSMVRQFLGALFQIGEDDGPDAAIARLEAGVASMLGEGAGEKAHFLGYVAGLDLVTSPHLSGIRHDARQIRDRAVRFAGQIIERLTARAPMVLVLEDAHDIDESSLDMIEEVVRSGQAMRLMILCLGQRRLLERRPDWGGSVTGAARIELQPLDERQSRRLVAEILRKAGKLPADLRNLIVGRAEGNPFYIEELIKALIADGVIVPAADKWEIQASRLPRLRVPATLADLLRARVQLVGGAERSLLADAAVVGRSFWAGALGPDGGGEAALAALAAHNLIVPQPETMVYGEREYRFSHELLREVLYEQIPPEQRAAGHRRVAAWLIARGGERADDYAGLIAGHYEHGGDRHNAGVWHGRAGDQARDAYAVETAIAHYRRAIALLDGDPAADRALLSCYRGLGFLQHELAHLAEAVATYRQMRELAARLGDTLAAAQALQRLAMVYDDASEPHTAHRCARESLELAQASGDRDQIIFSMITLSLPETRVGSPQGGLDLGMRALGLARESDNRSAVGKALNKVGLAYEQLGDYAAAIEHIRESVAIYRDLGDLSEVATQLNNMSYLAHNSGHFVAARGYAEDGLAIAREIGSRVNEIYLLTNLSGSLLGLGDYHGAEAAAREGVHLSEINRMAVFPHFYMKLAQASLGLDRVTEALEAAQQGVDLARSAGDPRDLGNAWRVLGMAIARLPEPQGAPPCFSESLRLLDATGASVDRARSLREWARYELRHGDGGRGREMSEEARALFARAGLAYEIERTPAVAGEER